MLVYCTHPAHLDPKYPHIPWNCTVHKVKPRYRWDYARNEWVEVKP